MKTDNYKSPYQLNDLKYELIEEIGRGEFEAVYRANRIKTDRQTETVLYSEEGALRIIEICNEKKFKARMSRHEYNEDKVWEYFINQEKLSWLEIQNQKKILQEDGAYAVNIRECDIYVNKEEYNVFLFVFMELLTPLSRVLKDRNLEADEIYRLGQQIGTALDVCRRNRIYHRDIKVSNLFMTSDGDFKLGDFGTCPVMGKESVKKRKEAPWYMDPEAGLGNDWYSYNESADIYSFGMLLYYLFNDRHYPFLPLCGTYGEADFKEALKRKNNYDRPAVPVNSPSAFADVILQMLQKPEERIPDMETFLKKWESVRSELEKIRRADRKNRETSENCSAKNEYRKTECSVKDEDEKTERSVKDEDEKTERSAKSGNEKAERSSKNTDLKKQKFRWSGIIAVFSVCILAGGLVIAAAFWLHGSGRGSAEDNVDQQVSSNEYKKEADSSSDDSDDKTQTASTGLESTVELIFDNNVLVEYRGKSEVLNLPDGLKGIGEGVFSENLNITHITIPDGVEFIGESAFKNCRSLSEIEFPNSVESIGANAFSGCEKLQNLILPENLLEIGENAFLGCTGLTEIVFPEKLRSIGKMAFLSCGKLKKVELGSEIQTIGESAFQSCLLLKDVSIEAMSCEMGGNVFLSCSKDLILTCPENSKAHAYAIEYDIQYQFIQ